MARKFVRHTGICAPLNIANIDTDAIIPKQFLQKVTRQGFGQHLFHNWRFLDADGLKPDPSFVLNQSPWREGTLLLTRENFGCGSSREHAPWALIDYGFQAIIAAGFADIFYSNALNNQLLPVTLSSPQIDALFRLLNAQPALPVSVDLVTQTVSAGEKTWPFVIDAFHRDCLLNGLDSIDLTLRHQHAIADYERRQPLFLR